MNSKVFVLTTKLTLDSTISQQHLSEFNNMYFAIDENSISVSNVDWFNKDSFEEELDNLITFIKQIKNKIKGEILVYVKDGDDVFYQGRYKVSTKAIDFEQCELNINVKKAKGEKPKTLTEAEKLDLFREYWEEKQKVPGKSEVYKGFRLGTFFVNMMRNQNTIEVLNQIMNETN